MDEEVRSEEREEVPSRLNGPKCHQSPALTSALCFTKFSATSTILLSVSEGIRARRPAVARRRVVELVDNDFRSERSRVTRTPVSANGHTRDYTTVSTDNAIVYGVERWMTAEEVLVIRVYDGVHGYVVKWHLVLKA